MGKIIDLCRRYEGDLWKLRKEGFCSIISLIDAIDIYDYYLTTSHIESKMERYEYTADKMKIGTTTVRNIVRIMSKDISDL